MLTVLLFERKPHCVSSPLVMWLESMFSRIRAKILVAAEIRYIPQKLSQGGSVSFFVDGHYARILPGL